MGVVAPGEKKNSHKTVLLPTEISCVKKVSTAAEIKRDF